MFQSVSIILKLIKAGTKAFKAAENILLTHIFGTQSYTHFVFKGQDRILKIVPLILIHEQEFIGTEFKIVFNVSHNIHF